VSKVFEAVAKDVNGLVDDEEAVVLLVGELYVADGRILAVMLVEILLEGVGKAGVDGARNLRIAFGKDEEGALVTIVVDEGDAFLSASDEG